MNQPASDFADKGFVVIPSVASASLVAELREALQEVDGAGRAGIRSLMACVPAVRRLALDDLGSLAAEILGSTVHPVKATLFDKTASANWKLPFHQDTVIAVRERHEVEGFGPWSVKAGVPHVGAPEPVLSRMVALRLHLDDTPVSNGALRVVPGSHDRGRLAAPDALALRAELGEVVIPVGVGGVLAMRPLLLHGSKASASPGRRRVVHVEYSSIELPAPLEWAA